MINIRTTPFIPDNHRAMVPYFSFKRVPLNEGKLVYKIPFTQDFGGDFLLKRIGMRWSGFTDITTDIENVPAVPPELPDFIDPELSGSGYQDYANVVYIDLAQTGTGHAGTTGDPLSIADHQTLMATLNTDTTFKLRGEGEFYDPSAYPMILQNGLAEVDYVPWDAATYGPWKLTVNSYFDTVSPVVMAGGILRMWDSVSTIYQAFNTNTNLNVLPVNMIVICSTAHFHDEAVHGYSFRHNWIYSYMGTYFHIAGYNFRDSIFQAATFEGVGSNLINCSYEVGTDNSGNVYTACKAITGLTPPVITLDQTALDWRNFVHYIPFGGAIAGWSNGLYGYSRFSAGPFDFSNGPDFYINLSQSGSLHAGTALDGFSVTDWQELMVQGYFPRSLFRMFGTSQSWPGHIFWNGGGGAAHEYRGYNPTVNGPWRLRALYGFKKYANTPLIQDGILVVVDAGGNRADFLNAASAGTDMPLIRNCWIYAATFTTEAYLDPDYFCGNVVDCITFEQDNSGGFSDCLIKADTFNGATGTIYNCAFDVTTLNPGTVTFTDCFTSWAAPVMPSYIQLLTGTQSIFSVLNFKTNIPDAIWLGSNAPGYTETPGGLFGIERFAIGTGWFNTQENTGLILAELKTSLRKMTSQFMYYEEIFPHLFTSPCDNFDSFAVPATMPVDNKALSMVFERSRRMSYKNFNWIVENNGVIVIDIIKNPPAAKYPEFIDIVVEGYFIQSEYLPKG